MSVNKQKKTIPWGPNNAFTRHLGPRPVWAFKTKWMVSKKNKNKNKNRRTCQQLLTHSDELEKRKTRHEHASCSWHVRMRHEKKNTPVRTSLTRLVQSGLGVG